MVTVVRLFVKEGKLTSKVQKLDENTFKSFESLFGDYVYFKALNGEFDEAEAYAEVIGSLS